MIVKFYFYDHETMDTEEGTEVSLKLTDMVEIAASFNELLNNIKKDDNEVCFKDKTNIFSSIINFYKIIK